MNHLEHLVSNKTIFFNYMNEHYKIVQHSNLFYRDLQYAIMSYFKMKDISVKYSAADKLAEDFIKSLIKDNELTEIDYKSWKINFEVGIKKKEAELEGVENE